MPFLAPLLPVLAPMIPSLLGGIFGGKAAAPAAAGAQSAAESQSAMINMIMQMAQQMAPMQQELAGGAMDLARGLPMQDIMQMTMMQNLLPTMMPEVLRARGEERIRTPAERAGTAKREELSRRGISGPLAERLLAPIEEGKFKNLAQYGSDVAGWEAEQTLANRGKAFNDMLRIFGLAQGATQVPDLPFGAAANLQGSFTEAAGNAAAPWTQLGGAIQDPLSAYLGNLFKKPPSVPVTGNTYLNQPPPSKGW